MGEKLSGWEAFILWALLAVGGGQFRAEMAKAKLLPNNDKALFDGLSRSGLITKERRGSKGFWIELTDKGWDTAGKNLGAALPPTRKASAVLQAWLTHLQAFMQARGFVLADILSPRRPVGVPSPDQAVELATPSTPDYPALRERIRKAYFDLTGGFNKRALLSDLRERLKDIDHATLDETLKRMHLEEGTTLSGLNNPQEITPAIRNAGLSFKGEPMYVLWITK